MIIAIDGLGVNGKSTLAKRIAEKLNFKNCDKAHIPENLPSQPF